jgi:hypothetical protein
MLHGEHRAQQRLGRNAAPVETDAAQVVALDDRRLEAELGGADGGDVAAGAGADDDHIEALVSHGERAFALSDGRYA